MGKTIKKLIKVRNLEGEMEMREVEMRKKDETKKFNVNSIYLSSGEINPFEQKIINKTFNLIKHRAGIRPGCCCSRL